MTQNLTARISAILTSAEARTVLGNEAAQAYATATQGQHTPFSVEDFNNLANNGIVPKAVANASLVIAAMRGDTSDAGRISALKAMAAGVRTEVEKLVVRTQANTAWDARSLSRGVARLQSNPNHVDFDALGEPTKVLDDVVAQAVAAKLLEMLQS